MISVSDREDFETARMVCIGLSITGTSLPEVKQIHTFMHIRINMHVCSYYKCHINAIYITIINLLLLLYSPKYSMDIHTYVDLHSYKYYLKQSLQFV